MLAFLRDENFKGDIVRGLRHQRPELDLVRVQDVGLSGADDEVIGLPSHAPKRVRGTSAEASTAVLPVRLSLSRANMLLTAATWLSERPRRRHPRGGRRSSDR